MSSDGGATAPLAFGGVPDRVDAAGGGSSTSRTPARLWRTARFDIDLGRPRVMGIVNVTPDSFADGGLHAQASAAIARCEQLVREGADILDIGGESTRPGA
ncbi:MAG TPA: dihydropteroate synthase, partial [Rubrivivax sp.]|nr:dihydropteroate synthase [Rubrivivax sp.]